MNDKDKQHKEEENIQFFEDVVDERREVFLYNSRIVGKQWRNDKVGGRGRG